MLVQILLNVFVVVFSQTVFNLVFCIAYSVAHYLDIIYSGLITSPVGEERPGLSDIDNS